MSPSTADLVRPESFVYAARSSQAYTLCNPAIDADELAIDLGQGADGFMDAPCLTRKISIEGADDECPYVPRLRRANG